MAVAKAKPTTKSEPKAAPKPAEKPAVNSAVQTSAPAIAAFSKAQELEAYRQMLQIRRFEDLAPDDYRRHSPRFQGENFARNLELVRRIEAMAAAKGCTPAQLALAWVLARGDDIVPIPGTRRVKYLDDNLGAVSVRLTADDLTQIDAILPAGAASGARYNAQAMLAVGR